jgi:hypothetical protein
MPTDSRIDSVVGADTVRRGRCGRGRLRPEMRPGPTRIRCGVTADDHGVEVGSRPLSQESRSYARARWLYSMRRGRLRPRPTSGVPGSGGAARGAEDRGRSRDPVPMGRAVHSAAGRYGRSSPRTEVRHRFVDQTWVKASGSWRRGYPAQDQLLVCSSRCVFWRTVTRRVRQQASPMSSVPIASHRRSPWIEPTPWSEPPWICRDLLSPS